MSQFSRRTIVAAIDVLLDSRLSHADMSHFLLKAGPKIHSAIKEEPFSLQKRMNDLIQFVDNNPDYPCDDGPLEMLIVEKATVLIKPYYESTIYLEPSYLPPVIKTFMRTLRQDGFDVTDGSLRPTFPKDIGKPGIESELMRLLEVHEFSTAKGHLDQAFDAHTRGNWAGANSQLRTFVDALFDEIAGKLDQSALTLKSGQAKRAKLAKLGFFSISLNEWDNDGKGFINGLIKRLHPEGPHPGLSDDDDSTFRMHIVLLTAMLFLRRYDQKSKCLSDSESDSSPW